MRSRFVKAVLTATLFIPFLWLCLYTFNARVARPNFLSKWPFISWSHGRKMRDSVPVPPSAMEHHHPPTKGSNYHNGPETVLVFATTTKTNNSWIDQQLGDLLYPNGPMKTAIYVNDNKSAPLHTPDNKGHEVMTILTYIIDRYDDLPPISIFLHGHSAAWHNNWVFGMQTSDMLHHLRPEKIVQDGYFNLRCHWSPGCPEHLFPFATEYNPNKPEELFIREAWQEIFQVSEIEVPEVVAQPCCSQFAVTRESIQRHPRAVYEHFRAWLLRSDTRDSMSGRFFEYFWQVIFKGVAVYCPDPRICTCEAYGVCFEDPQEYNRWHELNHEWEEFNYELGLWADWDESMVTNGAVNYMTEQQIEAVKWLMEEKRKREMVLVEMRRKALEFGASEEGRKIAVDAAKRNGTPIAEEFGMLFWDRAWLQHPEIG